MHAAGPPHPEFANDLLLDVRPAEQYAAGGFVIGQDAFPHPLVHCPGGFAETAGDFGLVDETF